MLPSAETRTISRVAGLTMLIAAVKRSSAAASGGTGADDDDAALDCHDDDDDDDAEGCHAATAAWSELPPSRRSSFWPFL